MFMNNAGMRKNVIPGGVCQGHRRGRPRSQAVDIKINCVLFEPLSGNYVCKSEAI